MDSKHFKRKLHKFGRLTGFILPKHISIFTPGEVLGLQLSDAIWLDQYCP